MSVRYLDEPCLDAAGHDISRSHPGSLICALCDATDRAESPLPTDDGNDSADKAYEDAAAAMAGKFAMHIESAEARAERAEAALAEAQALLREIYKAAGELWGTDDEAAWKVVQRVRSLAGNYLPPPKGGAA